MQSNGHRKENSIIKPVTAETSARVNEAKIETERCTLKNINSVEYKLRYSNETAFKGLTALNTNFY